jgi:hypothetical protein
MSFRAKPKTKHLILSKAAQENALEEYAVAI